MSNNKKSKWGFGVFVLYGTFVLFMLALVIYASVNDIQIVEKNYYEKDIAYQDQIDRIERTNELDIKPTIGFSPESGNILINFPVENSDYISGTIKFFRPSNARLDFQSEIMIDSNGIQEIDIDSMVGGYWIVKMSWMVDSLEYYQQEPLIIN